MNTKIKREKRDRRHKRVRAKVFGTAERPRLCVFRSNRYIYAQMINDEKGQTILSSSDFKFKKLASSQTIKTGKIALAFEVGKLIAQKAKEKKIKQAVFDRGGYLFHGRVKALVEGAREAGLEF